MKLEVSILLNSDAVIWVVSLRSLVGGLKEPARVSIASYMIYLNVIRRSKVATASCLSRAYIRYYRSFQRKDANSQILRGDASEPFIFIIDDEKLKYCCK